MLVVLACCNLLAATLASSDGGLVAVSGQNASISCSCSNGRCPKMIRWIRVYSDRSLETSDTFCEPQRCLSQTSSTSANLTLLQVGKEDSALYYCGEKQSTHLEFSDRGTFLQVLEEDEVWRPTCDVMLFTEWKSSDNMKDRKRRHPNLRCRASGLRVPWVDILWRSTGKTPRILKTITWIMPENNTSFSVWSQIHLDEPRAAHPEYQHYGETDETDELSDNFDYWPREEEEWEEEEEGEEDDYEWWCEVHLGPNLTVRSDHFAFKWRKDDPDWCPAVLYASVAICVLGVLVLLIHFCHRLLQEYSAGPTPSPDRASEQVGLTYVELSFDTSAGLDRRPPSRRTRGTLDGETSAAVRYSLGRVDEDPPSRGMGEGLDRKTSSSVIYSLGRVDEDPPSRGMGEGLDRETSSSVIYSLGHVDEDPPSRGTGEGLDRETSPSVIYSLAHRDEDPQ